MRISRRIVGTVLGLTLVASTLSGCAERPEEPAGAVTSMSPSAQDAVPSALPAEPTATEPATPDSGETPVLTQNAQESGSPDDPAEYTGPGEDPATMQDDEPIIDPNAVAVDYETLPGGCSNDVPLPRAKHAVIEIETTADGECIIQIDSRGDSLFMIGDIAEQLDEAGFTQTSAPSDDDSATAVNTMSYRTSTHEVYVTVAQDGISGVIITYALTDPTRGNG